MSEIKVGECWKDIKGYEKYQISNFGRVRRKAKIVKVGIKNVKKAFKEEQLLKPLKFTKGYLGIKLYNNSGAKNYKIHRLVAEAFIPNPDNLEQVNHIDGDKTNNKVNNLEWCSCQENMEHSYRIGLRDKTKLAENMRKLGKSKKGLESRWKKKYV